MAPFPMVVLHRSRLLRFLVFAVLLIVALVVVVRWWAGSTDEGSPPGSEEDRPVIGLIPQVQTGGQETDFFVEARLEREKTRSQMVEILREIVNNPNSSPDSRKLAQDHLVEISNRLAAESEAEQLIMAKDFEDALVYVYADSALIIVKAQEITRPQAAQVASAVNRVTGISWEKVSIFPRQ